MPTARAKRRAMSFGTSYSSLLGGSVHGLVNACLLRHPSQDARVHAIGDGVQHGSESEHEDEW
eukprot:6206340-Prymnesium_polylepis.1